ncbi:TcfC E-set like domain-containing protein [Shewanella japonica]|uniref:TcfC E-set like domain-containing protein n=1 Tax=Shewanella japonica TaxID=93973 RepID=UPI0024953AE7|nr:TcfC E-set like domain-containing protein [Shewanella japonica]
MTKIKILALISIVGFSICLFGNKDDSLLGPGINKLLSINEIKAPEPTVENIVFSKKTVRTNETVQAQSEIEENTEITFKSQSTKQAEAAIKNVLAVKEETVFKNEITTKEEKNEQIITDIKVESNSHIQAVDKTKETIKSQVAEDIDFQKKDVTEKGQKQSRSMLQSKQSVKQFYDELFEMPMVIKVLVNNELSSLGLFKVSQDGSVLLKEIYKGDMPLAVEDSLKLGINYIRCDGETQVDCGIFDAVNFSLETMTLELNYVDNTNVQNNLFNEELTSARLDSFASFSDSNASIYSNGMLNVGGHRFFGSIQANSSYYSDSSFNVELDSLYYRKSFDSNQLDLGLIRTSDAEQGAQSVLFNGTQSFLGAFFSNQSDLSNTEQAYSQDNDLVLILNDSSNVEVYYSGRLIDSQYLNKGIQRLSVQNYPKGNYNVTIIVKERSGSEYTLDKFVYNNANQQDFSYGASFGVPVNDSFCDTINCGDDNIYASFYVNKNFFNLINAGVKTIYEGDKDLALSLNLNSRFENLSFYSDSTYYDYFNQNFRVTYNEGPISTSMGYLYKGKEEKEQQLTASLVYRLNRDSNLGINYNQNFTEGNSMGISSGITYQNRFEIGGFNPSVTFGANHSSYLDKNDTVYYVSFNMNFGETDDNISLDFSARNNDGKNIRTIGAGYQKNLPGGFFNNYNLSAELDENNMYRFGGSTYIEHKYMKGSIFAEHQGGGSDNQTSVGGNLSSSLYTDGQNFVMSKNKHSSGVIINVESEVDAEDLYIMVGGYMQPLETGSNFISLQSFTGTSLNFIHKKDYKLSKDRATVTVGIDEISSIDLQVENSVTVIGRLMDNDTAKSGVHIENHVSETYSGDDGVFMLQVSAKYPSISFNGQEVLVDVKKASDANIIYIGDLLL